MPMRRRRRLQLSTVNAHTLCRCRHFSGLAIASADNYESDSNEPCTLEIRSFMSLLVVA
jgi:hypothetical protein